MEPAYFIIPLVVMGAPVLIALIFMRYRYVQTQARYRMLPGKQCMECGNTAVIKKDGCEFCTACGAIGACG